MLWSDRKRRRPYAFGQNLITVIATVILAVAIVAAQDLPLAVPSAVAGTSAIRPPVFNGFSALSGIAGRAARPGQVSNVFAAGFAAGGNAAERQAVRSGRTQRVTLEQVKQQSANRVAGPLAHLNQLSVEAAKQHRLGVQADYFPKFGATFLNLHTTDFLG